MSAEFLFFLSGKAQASEVLLTSQQVRVVDALSAASGVDTPTLMQRAGEAVAREVLRRYSRCKVLVLCGPGHNGGDGLVAATALKEAGWPVTVALYGTIDHQGWPGPVEEISPALLESAELIVDALYGVGLSRPIEGQLADLFSEINAKGTPVVAVDMPSGVESNSGAVRGAALRAQLTVTLARKKPGLLLLPGRSYAGRIVVADIGLSPSIYEQIQPNLFENGPELWRAQFPKPTHESHKYTRGVALIAGSAKMSGAARLAARAAQRVGAGLVKLAVPAEAASFYQLALESCVILPLESETAWGTLLEFEKAQALLIGPGYGRTAQARRDVLKALATHKPCVLDADALSVFADNPAELFAALHDKVILTPHDGEFSRLFSYDGDNLRRASLAAVASGAVVVLKGASTVIAGPDGTCLINTNAPADLATAGAGDVLAGLMVGLLAQGMPVLLAASAAVWLQGAAAASFGRGLIAEDIVERIPLALKELA